MVSLRTKIIVFLFILLFFVTGTCIVAIFNIVSNSMRDELLSRGAVATESYARRIMDFVLSDKNEEMTAYIIDEKLRHNEIAYILVFNSAKELLSHSFIGDYPEDILKMNPLQKETSRSNIELINSPELGQIYDIAVPLEYEKGYMRIGFNKSLIDAATFKIIKNLILLTIIIMIVSISTVMFLAENFIIKPLVMVKNKAKEIGKGKLDSRIDYRSKDEIGDLVNAFNVMSESLSKVTISRDYFDNIISNISNMLLVFSMNGKISTVNKALCGHLGYSQEELIGKDVSLLFQDEAVPYKGRVLEKFIKDNSSIDKETVLISKDGKSIPVILSGTVLASMDCETVTQIETCPEFIKKGHHCENIKGVVFIAKDITELKQKETQVKEAADRFSIVINSVGDGITFSDKQGYFVIYNDRMQKITGYSIEEANSSGDFTMLLYPDAKERQKALENLDRVSNQNNPQEFETTIQAKDGLKKKLLVSSQKLQHQDSVMFLSVYHDITERQKREKEIIEANKKLSRNELALKSMLFDMKRTHKELENAQAQLVQSEKLSSLGQLSAGIAHEINNPLGFVANNLAILGEYIEVYSQILRAMDVLKKIIKERDLDKAVSMVKEINQLEENLNLSFISSDIDNLIRQSTSGTERIKKIVQDLRTFSRKDEGEMELNNVEEVLEGVINIVWNEIKYKAELKKEYGGIPLVKCNSQKLGQVFINLLVNASQAIKEKGEITVRTYVDDKYACIDVSDTGAGIQKKDMDKIFDPFFTTKEVGKGTGLGLSIGYDIVKQHKGKMEVASEAGKGTKFTIKLPI